MRTEVAPLAAIVRRLNFSRAEWITAMHEIIPQQLWIGHAGDARDSRLLLDAGIEAVIDLAFEEAPVAMPREIIYCRFPLIDGAGNDPRLVQLSIDTVCYLLNSATPMLVACGAGMSRSPDVVAAALSHSRGESPQATLDSLVQHIPHDVSSSFRNDVTSACVSS